MFFESFCKNLCQKCIKIDCNFYSMQTKKNIEKHNFSPTRKATQWKTLSRALDKHFTEKLHGRVHLVFARTHGLVVGEVKALQGLPTGYANKQRNWVKLWRGSWCGSSPGGADCRAIIICIWCQFEGVH